LNPIELVVIGAGLIGQKHIKFVNASKRCSLAGICDVDPSREALAAEFNVPFYQNVDEMLDRERPDGAIIATPNRLHLVAAEACARHSVHMLVEKPIADTLEDAHRIVNLAEETGVQLLVGHHRRHNPLIQQTRSIVQGGSLGKLVGVSVLWTLRKPDDYFEVTWRRSRPGGGPALINLIHDLDNMRFICGEIRQIQAISSSVVRGFEVEDTLSIALVFENGALGSILVSDAVAAPWSYELNAGENPFYPHIKENCYHFVGTSGALAFPQMERWHYADETKAGWHYPLEKFRHNISYADPLQGQLEHFCRVIKGEETPVVDGPDGTRSLAAVLAVLASAESQRPVTL